jgi:hypothetical protein
MFTNRQPNDVYQLMEVSYTANLTPGALTAGTHAVVSIQAYLGNPAAALAAQNPATFVLADELEIVPSAAIAVSCGGLIIQAQPSATPGLCTIAFLNTRGITVTPTSGQYTIIARRYTPELI